MRIPCRNLDLTRSIIYKQHRSLAKLAGQSIRQMHLIRGNSSSSMGLSTARNSPTKSKINSGLFVSDKEENEDKIADQAISDDRNEDTNICHRPNASPLNRMNTLGIDELSLDVLCLHVSELMGGAPIPIAQPIGGSTSASLEPIEAGDSSASLDFNWEQQAEEKEQQQQNQEMKWFEESLEHEQILNSLCHASAPILTGTGTSSTMFSSSLATHPQDDDEEQRMLEQGLAESSDGFLASNTTLAEDGEERIEVGPGEFLPLYGPCHTFQALVTGNILVTKCLTCLENLMVQPNGDLVICSDCWILSPVITFGSDGGELFNEDRPPASVGMGVKANEVKQWLETKAGAQSMGL